MRKKLLGTYYLSSDYVMTKTFSDVIQYFYTKKKERKKKEDLDTIKRGSIFYN